MRRLILLRHAKAESTAASGGDAERGLTERGRRDAALVARALARADLAPDLVLASPARRAQETWAAMASDFPGARVETARDLYLASAEQIAQAVADAQDAADVQVLMVVGHNPGLHEYAQSFLERRRATAPPLAAFPTASAAVITFDAQGRGAFERQLSPRDLGGGGGS
jgi:phosphohistidine phosphatase